MKESTQSVFQLEDVFLDVFLLFLEYLYTDTFSQGSYNVIMRLVHNKEQISPVSLQSLLVLANQYNVTRLCEICENLISVHITHNNVVEVLRFAEVEKGHVIKIKVIKMVGTVPTLSQYAMYVIHSEIAILSLTGGLLDLPPELRQEAVKYKKPYTNQGISTLLYK
jgi:hypothetical protein